MKKHVLLLTILFSMFILFGCNNDDDKVTNPPNDAPVENENANQNTNQTGLDDRTNDVDDNQATDDANQNGMQSGSKIHFTSFDLDIDHPDNKEFDIDYENDADGMEAEVKDTVKGNEHLQGDDAFNRIRPVFESFTFDKNSPDDEVISQVLKAFDLDDNFIEFELEIDFEDGTKKEYLRR